MFKFFERPITKMFHHNPNHKPIGTEISLIHCPLPVTTLLFCSIHSIAQPFDHMEVIKENHTEKEGPTKPAESSKLKSAPPEIITVDTAKNADEKRDAAPKQDGTDDSSLRHERTPKHANKTMGARQEGVQKSETKNPDQMKKPDGSEASPYPTQQKHGAPPQAMGMGGTQQHYQGQTHPNQPGYYSRAPPQAQGPPAEALPRFHGPPTVGGHNGAFSPHASQYRDPESSNHPAFYNNGGPPPTVSPGGPASRDGGDYRSGAPYYGNGRGGPGYQGLPYRLDNRHPPLQPQGYPREQRFDQAAYGRPPSHFGGLPHPNHPHAFNRGQQGAGYQDRPRNGYEGQPYQGRPPSYPHQPPQHGPKRQTVPHEKGPEQVHRADQRPVGGFTRAVSSSFDRSVKSKTSNEDPKPQVLGPGQHVTSPHDPGFAHGSDQRLPQHSGGSEAPSDDDSWRQLNQVESIDEDVLRARLKEKEAAKKASGNISTTKGTDQGNDGRPGSNNSSLTNSPTEHVQLDTKLAKAGKKHEPPIPTPSKLASLDSLSSVASAQEPMDTEGSKEGGPPSPGSSHASLDLLKCSSGSSGLLQGFPSTHLRRGSDGSYNVTSAYRVDHKRPLDERDPTPGKLGPVDEVRKGTADMSVADQQQPQDHPSKRSRHHEKEFEGKKKLKTGKQESEQTSTTDKASPLSIECTPPLSPGGENRGQQDKRHKSQASESSTSLGPPPGGSFFDAAPSYSIESAHSVTSREDLRRGSFPTLSRPGSSSSTIPPMGLSHSEGAHRDGVTQLPSWDLHQDSFGGGSLGGNNTLTSSFSFNDYQALGNTDINASYLLSHDRERTTEGSDQRNQLPIRQGHPPSVAESRNQSFEGGHYHGSFDMGYGGEGHPPGRGQQAYGENYNASQYGGQFPPSAPSWGTAVSAGSSGHHVPNFRGASSQGQYSQYPSHQRNGPPMPQSPGGRHQAQHPYQGVMMRNYSEDSTMRTSPPPGRMRLSGPLHTGSMNVQSSFQPPPEFAAPQNPHLSRRPPPSVFLMSSPPGGHPHSDPSLVPKRRAEGGIYSWTKEDDARLTNIMKKYKNPRNWDPIAKEHGRGKRYVSNAILSLFSFLPSLLLTIEYLT